MDLKNKNSAIVIQPPAAEFQQKIAELGVNYERQFKNSIPGYIIVQPFLHERDINTSIEEIQQNLSLPGFIINTELCIRKNEYKFEIGVAPKEVRNQKNIFKILDV